MQNPSTPVVALARSFPQRLQDVLRRYPWLLPLAGFCFGWASYALVDRGNLHVARIVAVLALIGWPWLIAEGVLGKLFERLTRGFLSVGAVRYITQSLQLEMLFFSLPFLIGASRLDPGHMIFTGLAVLAALVCSLDPLYSRFVGARPFPSIMFHAYCNFIGALVGLPLVAQLSVEASLPLALTLTGLMLLLCLPRALVDASGRQRVWRLCIFAVLPLLVWNLRHEFPAAGLRVSQAVMAQDFSGPLEPSLAFTRVEEAKLHEQGAIAFAAVRAPAGLSQSVEFVWRHQGKEVDRIPASINGGREAGYRVYSRKRAFPEDSRGNWRVDLLSPDGRLIYRWRFRVE